MSLLRKTYSFVFAIKKQYNEACENPSHIKMNVQAQQSKQLKLKTTREL